MSDAMTILPSTQRPAGSLGAWFAIAVASLAGMVAGMVVSKALFEPASVDLALGPMAAIILMGFAMIAAAVAGRLWVGGVLAIVIGAGFVLFAGLLDMMLVADPAKLLFAVVIASISFAARGALFARSGGGRGWWIAVAVVAGEAAMLATAAIVPGALPAWLLALLPAQWASSAIQAAITGAGISSANANLLALGGTGAATMIVIRLWPRRWPYLIMFTVWLGMSALVLHSAQMPEPVANQSGVTP